MEGAGEVEGMRLGLRRELFIFLCGILVIALVGASEMGLKNV